MSSHGPIVVDDRQKTPSPDIRVSEFLALGVPSHIDRLPLGDYRWEVTHDDGAAVTHLVEEKLLDDLISSANDGRLGRFTQAETEPSLVRALLVVGTYEYGVNHYNGHWDVTAIDNLLVSVQQRGVYIIRAVSAGQVAERLVGYYRKTGREESSLDRTIRPSPAGYYMNPARRDAVRLLMCLPGVGEKKAQNILDHHRSIASALHCIEENTVCEAEGVGKKMQTDARSFVCRTF